MARTYDDCHPRARELVPVKTADHLTIEFNGPYRFEKSST